MNTEGPLSSSSVDPAVETIGEALANGLATMEARSPGASTGGGLRLEASDLVGVGCTPGLATLPFDLLGVSLEAWRSRVARESLDLEDALSLVDEIAGDIPSSSAPSAVLDEVLGRGIAAVKIPVELVPDGQDTLVGMRALRRRQGRDGSRGRNLLADALVAAVHRLESDGLLPSPGRRLMTALYVASHPDISSNRISADEVDTWLDAALDRDPSMHDLLSRLSSLEATSRGDTYLALDLFVTDPEAWKIVPGGDHGDPLIDAVRRWLLDDPDPTTRRELAELLADAEKGSNEARAELHARFDEPVAFGTAGLRAEIGGGPARMNRAVARRMAAGMARVLVEDGGNVLEDGVVVGHDARRMSAEMAEDVCRVLAGAGLRVHRIVGLAPTPLTAFGVKYFNAAAGVMVTASHNPPNDNGIKVYWRGGAQIIPPIDERIALAIESVGSLADIPLVELDDPRVVTHDTELRRAYLDGVLGLRLRPKLVGPRVAYTPMHGVGRDTVLAVFHAAGYPQPVVVAQQGEPDGTFPTVSFPNPEEPGALDLLLQTANEANVDLAIANDPDADRLSVSVRRDGAWQTLTGDEVGVLLADHVLREGPSDRARLVVTSLVSSRLLSRMAAAYLVEFAETLTGFKWIADAARRARADHDTEFVFGYEEALGYCIGELVADKDGISAALLFCELAAVEAEAGRSVLDRLDDISRTYGVFGTRQRSVRFGGPDWRQAGIEAVDRLLDAATASHASGETEIFSNRKVVDVRQPSGSMVVVLLDDDTRIMARPSGTEPKLKVYIEVVQPVAGSDVHEARAQAQRRLDTEFVLVEGIAAITF